MDILEFLNGKGGMLILAGIVVFALIFQQYKKWKYFKRPKNKK
tara:strand:- start:476 stop:604 length:129 start_codon:yes stop_codon:yes gene_type:complete